MTTEDLRKKLHEWVENADDKKLEALYIFLEEDIIRVLGDK